MKRVVGKLVKHVQKQAREKVFGHHEHVKAIIALHNGDFLNAKFPKISNYLSNDIRNTSEIQATFKDIRSFNVDITIGNTEEIKAMLDQGVSIILMP